MISLGWTPARRVLGVSVAAIAMLAVVTACASPTNSGAGGSSQPRVTGPVVSQGSPVAGSASSPQLTPSAASPVQIIQVDVSQADAQVRLQNLNSSQSGTVNLAGWTLQVGSTQLAFPSDARIGAGESLVVHAGAQPGAPGNSATPTAVPSPGAAQVREIFLGGEQGQGRTFREALQPGVQIQLFDERSRSVSQFLVPPAR